MGMKNHPEPLSSAEWDVSDLPFPDALLIELSAEIGLTPHDARALARSIGWIEVPGGWQAHKQ